MTDLTHLVTTPLLQERVKPALEDAFIYDFEV